MQTAFLTTYSEQEFEAKIIDLVNQAIKQNTHERIAYKEQQSRRKILSIDEAADLIKLSKSRIYAMAPSGMIPNFKKGNRLMFYEDELMKWVESGKRLSKDEINQAADEALLKETA